VLEFARRLSPTEEFLVSRTRSIAQAGMIAAVYGALTILTIQFLGGLAWGPVQFRISEAVTVVAFFTPAAIPGLTIGSVVANLYSFAVTGNPFSLLDVVLGSLATLLGAWWTWRFRSRTWLGLLGPVVTNALIVPTYLPLMLRSFGLTEIPLLGLSLGGSWLPLYLALVASVAAGEAAVMYGLGLPLLFALRRLGLAEQLSSRA
jgi:uncharacterized membrane protein